jgi:hypothetical protein
MAWLDFLKNGNELTELLIEGTNPYGNCLLKQVDVDTLRDHIAPEDQVLAYVLGRVTLAGRGLWVLTDTQLLISESDSDKRVHAYKLQDISAAECVKGKYGYTLRIVAMGQQRSVYGTSAQFATVFYRALAQKAPCTPIHKPTALHASDLAEVVRHFGDAALRLQPMKAMNSQAVARISELAHAA